MQLASSSVPYQYADRRRDVLDNTESEFPWFALRTRSNFENVAALSLQNRGLKPYLPAYRNRRRWSDRIVVSDTPLFRGYVFCRFNPTDRLSVLTARGVVSIVSHGTEPAPVDEREIEAVQTILCSGLATEPCPFLRLGQTVRVVRGALTGVEGVLVRKKSDFRLVISVTMLQRSVSVEIEREWVSVR